MKRVKRNIEERVYKQGYKEGFEHHSDSHCPKNLKKRALWLAGFSKGRKDKTEGIFLTPILH